MVDSSWFMVAAISNLTLLLLTPATVTAFPAMTYPARAGSTINYSAFGASSPYQ